jgi:hypothetical protein
MSATSPAGRVVGVVPWLPWPLSAWRWWSAPVGAERLAALRIGLAAFLFLDIVLTYLPAVDTFFGQDSLGTAAIFDWRTDAPRLSWTLLRGFGNPLLSFLCLLGCAGTTLWVLADLGTRALHGGGPRERDPLRFSLPLWCATSTLLVLGVWARLVGKNSDQVYAWLPPVPILVTSLSFVALELLRYLRSAEGVNIRVMVLLGFACLFAGMLCALGVYLSLLSWSGPLAPDSVWVRVFGNWQNEPVVLRAAMFAWAGTTLLLLLGLWTKPAAIVSWLLSISFANINDRIDNAGDTIRIIVQFYLMLCPCGAVWSLDRLWRRWRGQDAPVLYVSPWPIRLLFVQLVFIYFCNGFYKMFGGSWRDGDSLFYVLADFTLTRFSPSDNPLPLWALRAMTWTVLVWEVTFPVLALNRWTRLFALVLGACFHLGIFASMELGCFVPYTLCIYLAFLPWERWVRKGAAIVPPESSG